MYCDHPSCKKEVDINSVAVSQPKSAFTMFNEDGLGMTRVSGGNDSIVNVCKSCGKSEYLWESIEEMHRVSKVRAIEEREQKIRNKKTNRVIFFLLILILIGIIYIYFVIIEKEKVKLKIGKEFKEKYIDGGSDKESEFNKWYWNNTS